jgi:hypothetical protein
VRLTLVGVATVTSASILLWHLYSDDDLLVGGGGKLNVGWCIHHFYHSPFKDSSP